MLGNFPLFLRTIWLFYLNKDHNTISFSGFVVVYNFDTVFYKHPEILLEFSRSPAPEFSDLWDPSLLIIAASLIM